MRKTRLVTLAGTFLLTSGCTSLLPVQSAPATSSQSSTSSGTQNNPEVVNALSDVQDLRREIKDLRNRVERQEFELDKLKNRQRELYDDLDRRIRQSERVSGISAGQAPVASASTGVSAPVFSNVPQTGSSNALPPTAQGTGRSSTTIQPVTVLPSNVTVGSPAPVTGATPSVGAVTPGQVAIIQPQLGSAPPATSGPVSVSTQDAYDQAFGLLKQSRYADAVQAFEVFVQNNPANDLTDDAYYWMAEARYVTREFESALSGFRTVATRFPSSQRVPASYLKVGYIQYEIGAYADARETLTFIMKNYPTHRVAVSAETRLKKMDREGR